MNQVPPPQPMYAAPPYAPQVARKGPNPAGTAGFILALAGILLYIICVIIMVAWLFQQFDVRQLARMSRADQVEFQQVLQEKLYTDMLGLIVGMWIAMGIGVVGLILSIVGMARKNAKKGLAIAGLVLGVLASICAVTGAIGGVARMVGGG